MIHKFFSWFTYIFIAPIVAIGLLINVMMVSRRARVYRTYNHAYTVKQRYKWIYKGIKKILYLKRIKVDANGWESIPKSPALYICNHKSNVDTLALFKVLYAAKNSAYEDFSWVYIAKAEMAKKGFLFNLISIADILFIDRENLRQQVNVYHSELDMVKKEKKSVVIFAEGTRIYDHTIGEFHHGSFRLACDCMIPIVPISVYGSSGLMDKNKDFINKKRTVYFKFLKPLNPVSFFHNKTEFISETVRKSIQNEYDTMHNNDLAKKPIIPEEE